MLEQLKDIVRRAGAIMLDASVAESDITAKEGHANFVTVYDVAVQRFLRKELSVLLPKAAFLGEEEDCQIKAGSGYTFVVDPIDGTTNFICGYQMSAVSVGLALDGEVLMGVVYNPFREEMYWAEKEKALSSTENACKSETEDSKTGSSALEPLPITRNIPIQPLHS